MKRLAEWGSGTKCRGGAVRRTAGKSRWFPGSLRSRPLPASGGAPPFRCRSTGERSWTALPLGQRMSPPRSGQRSGGVARRAEGARCAGPQGAHGGFLARFARAPSPPPAVLPRSAAAPRGRGVGRPCRWGRGFLPHEAVSGVGEWHEVPRGRGPEDRRESTVVSWLASLAPPPRLRRCSPVPLPLHGGEVLDGPAAGAEDLSPTKRSVEWGSGTKCRGGAVRRTAGKPRWFPGSLRSRPLPASGGAPPFRCRSTGETFRISPPAEGRGKVPPLELRISPPRSGQRSGGVARSAEGARSAGPQGTHGGFLARFARAPSPPPAVLPRSAAAPRGRSPDAQVPGAKY